MSTTVQNATCVMCGKSFEALRRDAKYCSGACRSAASRARKRGDTVPEVQPAAPEPTAPLLSTAPKPPTEAPHGPSSPTPVRDAHLDRLEADLRRLLARLEATHAETTRAEARHQAALGALEAKLSALEQRVARLAGDSQDLDGELRDLEAGTLTAVQTLEGRLEAVEELAMILASA